MRLMLDYLGCNGTTELGRDEIYILVAGHTSAGSFQYRLPNPDGHWDMTEGDSLTGIQLASGPGGGGLPAIGSFLDAMIIVMEKDGGSTERWQQMLAALLQEIDDPYAATAGQLLDL